MNDTIIRRLVSYSSEAICLGLFMLSAATAAVLLQHPASPVSHLIHDEFLRRLGMGMAMGATAVALIYSPMGSRSGAHMNPAVTLAYLRLGQIRAGDAAGYVCAQFLGGAAGIVAATALLGGRIADPSVNYIATLPGESGGFIAFLLEASIAFAMMTLVLQMTSRPHLVRFTGVGAGVLIAVFVVFESPYSGMSMNPARTLASNVPAGAFSSLWIYFVAPVLGMQIAASLTGASARAPARSMATPHTPRAGSAVALRGHVFQATTPPDAAGGAGAGRRRSPDTHVLLPTPSEELM